MSAGRESLMDALDRWPCGCAKGFTPHGVGWLDCVFTDEDRAGMETSLGERCPECGSSDLSPHEEDTADGWDQRRWRECRTCSELVCLD